MAPSGLTPIIKDPHILNILFAYYPVPSFILLFVIPAEAGIQHSYAIIKPLDPVFQRGDGSGAYIFGDLSIVAVFCHFDRREKSYYSGRDKSRPYNIFVVPYDESLCCKSID